LLSDTAWFLLAGKHGRLDGGKSLTSGMGTGTLAGGLLQGVVFYFSLAQFSHILKR
jgi:hypothetical protein